MTRECARGFGPVVEIERLAKPERIVVASFRQSQHFGHFFRGNAPATRQTQSGGVAAKRGTQNHGGQNHKAGGGLAAKEHIDRKSLGFLVVEISSQPANDLDYCIVEENRGFNRGNSSWNCIRS